MIYRTILAFVLTLPFASTPLRAEASALIDFEIRDQFDHVHTDESFAGLPLVLIGADSADSAGSAGTGGWSKELQRVVREHGLSRSVRFAGLADLRSVPRFMRKTVRGSFGTEPSEWLMLDWKGQFPEAYGFERRSANVLLFDADGELLFQAAGREVDAEAVGRFERALGKLAGNDADRIPTDR